MKKLPPLALVLGALSLASCTPSTPAAPGARAPARSLDELVVVDPDFTFATSRPARLRLETAPGAAPVQLEVRDAKGRRLFKGALRQAMDLDLKLALGADGAVTVLSGQGAQTVSQTVTLVDGRAVVSL